MLVRELLEVLDGKVLCREDLLDEEVFHACSADMLSDVLLFVHNQSVLLTGLCNPQVMRTAEMLDILCVIIVRGKQLDEESIEMAKERDICVLATDHTMFTASGLLYEAGLRGGA